MAEKTAQTFLGRSAAKHRSETYFGGRSLGARSAET